MDAVAYHEVAEDETVGRRALGHGRGHGNAGQSHGQEPCHAEMAGDARKGQHGGQSQGKTNRGYKIRWGVAFFFAREACADKGTGQI